MMQITELHIYNFKSIREIHLTDIESALILVGQNSSGKNLCAGCGSRRGRVL